MSVRVALPLPPIAARIGDLALARNIWLLLLAQFVANLPNSATSIFLPAMAADLASDVSIVGGVRGLGGVAALICGVLVSPLIDRVARAWAVAGALALVAVGAVLAAYGSLPALALFFVLAGAAGAVHQPALQSAAADGRDAATGARAASMLSACGALSPMLAGPILAAPTVYWSWRGDFLAMGLGCMLLAAIAAATLARRPAPGLARPTYLAALWTVRSAPGALPLVLASTLRGTLQFAWLTYLAAYLVGRFGASTAEVALTWTLGGSAVFVANLAVGRLIGAAAQRAWGRPERLLAVSLLALTVLTPLGLVAPTLPSAILIAALTAGAHGAIIGATISLLVGRYTTVRGAVLGLNAAGTNLGLFAGAAIGGLALAWAGYPGLATTLGLLAAATWVAFAWALGRARPSKDEAPPAGR